MAQVVRTDAKDASGGIAVEPHLLELSEPANLRINDQIRRFREACRKVGCTDPYYHFAFGQSPFPPPPSVVEALRRHAGEHSYLPTAGLPQLREAVAAYHARWFRIPVRAEQVLTPTSAWVSYMPQARILRQHVVSMPVHRKDDFKLTPEILR